MQPSRQRTVVMPVETAAVSASKEAKYSAEQRSSKVKPAPPVNSGLVATPSVIVVSYRPMRKSMFTRCSIIDPAIGRGRVLEASL